MHSLKKQNPTLNLKLTHKLAGTLKLKNKKMVNNLLKVRQKGRTNNKLLLKNKRIPKTQTLILLVPIKVLELIMLVPIKVLELRIQTFVGISHLKKNLLVKTARQPVRQLTLTPMHKVRIKSRLVKVPLEDNLPKRLTRVRIPQMAPL